MSQNIEYHRFQRDDRCSEEGCRSRKYYIEDGKKFCQRGHEQAGFTQTQEDEDDFGTQGRTTRKKRVQEERVLTVLSGKEATDLYLQCYQLILWKQCHWLVTVKKFPKELETIVRDLWSLRVRLLHGEKDEDAGYASGTATVGFSSMSEGAETDGAMSVSSRWSRKSAKQLSGKLPRLVETLSLCYLGILLLRLPTSLGELYKWAANDEMVYNRAIKEIPKVMRSRLPGQFHAALELRSPLKGSAMHRSVLDLVEFYHIQFEMEFPPLNYPLLIFKHVRDLGLPIEIYPAVRRLADMLDIDFSYPIVQKRIRSVLTHPEIQLMCLIIVATKLSHPFDDIERRPSTESDPTIVKIDWKKWGDIMAQTPIDGLKRGEEVHVTDQNVLEMNKEKVDDYLDWYQRTWLDDRNPKMAEQILDLFPLDPISRAPAVEDAGEYHNLLKRVQKSLVIQKSTPEDEAVEGARRPGELYRRWRSVEELSESARPFFARAAHNVGSSLQDLVRGVFSTEVKLEIWSMSDRKRRLMEDSIGEEERDTSSAEEDG